MRPVIYYQLIQYDHLKLQYEAHIILLLIIQYEELKFNMRLMLYYKLIQYDHLKVQHGNNIVLYC